MIRTFADAEAISRAAAEEFVTLSRAAPGKFYVALAGGSTPRRLYQLLAGPPFRDQVDWSRVEFFWGDERAVPPDHADSNYAMAHEALLSKVPIAPAQVHRMKADSPDLDAAARDYQAEIARTFGVRPDGDPPAFDLVLLGMGPDGHTLSLFPHTPALKETVRWVVSNPGAKNLMRLTLTAPVVNRAARVLFLVAGADKAERLVEVLEGPPDHDRLPSQTIRPAGNALSWFVDQSAAARLKPGP